MKGFSDEDRPITATFKRLDGRLVYECTYQSRYMNDYGHVLGAILSEVSAHAGGWYGSFTIEIKDPRMDRDFQLAALRAQKNAIAAQIAELERSPK